MSPRGVARLVALLLGFVALGGHTFAQFETRASIPVSTEPFSIAVGDFNRDGRLDLAVTSYLPTNGVTILLGNGDGTFRSGMNYSVGVQLAYIVAASLRHNGILDLVVGDTGSDDVYALLGNGDGTFQAAVAYPAIGNSLVVSTGDFNGDGKLDVIAITRSVQCTCLSVFPGNGDGTFQPAVTTPVPYNIDAFALAVGHFDSDTMPDVAVAGQFGTANQVDILLGNGDGTFRPYGFYNISLSPQSVVTADFNGDKKADLAVGVYEGIGVLLGNGDGTFQQPVIYPTSYPTSLVVRDFDGDGRLDLAASNFGAAGPPPGATVLKGNGDGTFQRGVFYPAGKEIAFLAAGDFNGDKLPDLVLADNIGQSVITLLNTGVVSFSPTTPIKFPFQLVGTTSAAQTVTLTNTGASALTISSMKVKGQFGMTSTCVASVAPGANCTISVTFSPATQGSKSGTVTIIDSASSKPQVIELSGPGTVVELSPASLTFAAQKVGTTSAPQPVQITNTGTTTLSLTKIAINGAQAQDFSQTNNCGSAINAGASCTIDVTFAPRKTGTRTGVIDISDSGGGSPQNVPLQGTGN